MILWSRLWTARMCRIVRLRARMRTECVSARRPMTLIPSSKALSLILVAQNKGALSRDQTGSP